MVIMWKHYVKRLQLADNLWHLSGYYYGNIPKFIEDYICSIRKYADHVISILIWQRMPFPLLISSCAQQKYHETYCGQIKH